ncbi:MAG: hypothetical protein M1827_003541 [Pycnora praestabilis]|nr:MAG: hypothetical protein M1827_003541 [Pycnora praestabilis]
MAAKKKKVKKPTSLSHGRPPIFLKPAASLSSKATRTLIRSHHNLHKAHAKAVSDGDSAQAEALLAQIEQQGGLKSYQQASITGQSSKRGGDSSKVLMKWLNSLSASQISAQGGSGRTKLRLLEVGALSKSNACSRSNLFTVTGIDLNSQDKSILQQDFMKRPLPISEDDKFDIISLSLVLNYVPEAAGRGDMLRRICQFLSPKPKLEGDENILPSLFLVLPAPCVTNSRYLHEKKLIEIMNSLGFSIVHKKLSAKLAYSLWRYSPLEQKSEKEFKKIEVSPGKSRNNFAIILR